MSDKTVIIHDSKTERSRPISRVKRGERIVIARAGKPVREPRPAREIKKRSRSLDDPLLRVEEYAYHDRIGPTANEAMDRTVYGI